MPKFATLLLLCTTLFAQQKAPYEATWLLIQKAGNGYVVYNYPSLWDDGKTKSPVTMKIQGNQMTRITYSDDINVMTLSFDKIEKKDNDVYFFLVGNCFSFKLIDEKKHIAEWTNYFGCKNALSGKLHIGELYIDSLYNTFPIVDYEWKEEPIDGEAD